MLFVKKKIRNLANIDPQFPEKFEKNAINL